MENVKAAQFYNTALDNSANQLAAIMYDSFIKDFDSFIKDLESIGEEINPVPKDKEIIQYGIDRLEESGHSKLRMLWIAYYLGAGFGIDAAQIIDTH